MSPVVPSVLPAPGAGGLPAGRWICAVRPPRHRGGAAFLASAAGGHVRHGGLVLERSVGCVLRLGRRPVCRLGFFCCAEGEVSDGDDFIYPAAGTGRRHGPAYPEGCAPCLLPRHIPADPDGERHPGQRHPCPYSGYPSHRRRAGGGDQRPPSAPGAPHAGALAPAHRLGGWPSAGGEQACRYDGPRLQFPAGHAHRGRSPWPGSGARTSCSTR